MPPTGQVVNDVEQVPGITAKKANLVNVENVALRVFRPVPVWPSSSVEIRSGLTFYSRK
jgi:hypothetical protein